MSRIGFQYRRRRRRRRRHRGLRSPILSDATGSLSFDAGECKEILSLWEDLLSREIDQTPEENAINDRRFG